jgi:alkylation response protein AidB-like acyl-CoA dehydrogenase
MRSENYFTTNADLQFTFNHVVPWEAVVPAVEDGFRDRDAVQSVPEAVDLYREVLGLLGEYAGSEIAACASAVDRAGSQHGEGPVRLPQPLQENLKGLRELGVTGLPVPRRYGGEQFPMSVSSMVFEIIARACPSTMVQYAFFLSPAMMLLRFGSEEIKRTYIPRLAAGEISGSVAMTEPQAGSDVGNVAAIAREMGGCWRITGRKQFITNGIAEICIVLARSEEGSRGLDGLSLFLVERHRSEDGRVVENFTVERAEEKVCITASPTCGLAFDSSRAVLLGRRGAGWREILTFMNESRVAVGLQGLGTAQAALDAAQTYAAERVQMGKPIREHPLVADMLLDMEATVAGLRALAYEATVLYDLSESALREIDRLPEGHPRRTTLEREARRASHSLRELTPLVKWYGAEEVLRVCRAAMQIHGGYGVVREYEVERMVRDSLILPIYEGTSQIQALMATKDLLKAAMARPTVLAGGTVSASLAAASFDGEMGRLYRRARSSFNATLRALLVDLVRRGGAKGALGMVRGRPSIAEEDTAYILLHAERLTAALAQLHAARLLATQAMTHPERTRLALRALRRAVEVTATAERVVKSGDRSTLEAISLWQSAS